MNEGIDIFISEEWDAYKAGLEISKQAADIKGIKCLLLFATIHYQKQGFNKLLEGVYEKIPKDTKLVGGNVIGFITGKQNLVHGVACVALSYRNMDIAISYAKRTKRFPKRAARKSANIIKDELKRSKFKNKVLLSIISGSEILKFPGMPAKAIIPIKFPDKIWYYFLKMAQIFLQKGFGREDVIIEEVMKILPDYNIIGMSTVDDKMLINYQFYNRKVLKNSMVLLGMATDLMPELSFASGAKMSKKKFKITKLSKDKQIIHKINGRPALPELISIMGWPKKIVLNEKRWVSLFPRFPLGFYKDGKIILRPWTLLIGNSIAFMSKIESKEGFIALMSGSDLVKAIDELNFKQSDFFGLFISCAVRQMGLGRNAEIVRKKIRNIYKDKPFLLLHTAGEASRCCKKPLNYLNESVALLTLK